MYDCIMGTRIGWLAIAVAITASGGCGDDEGSSGAGDADDAASSGSGATGAASGSGATGTGGATSSSGSGAATATASATGSGGGMPACVTDVVLLAEAFQSVDCSYPLNGVDDGIANVVLEINNAPQQLCRRASSQGCDVQSPGGWWTVGEEVLLCDSSCTSLVETRGAKLYLWVGCPSDNCL